MPTIMTTQNDSPVIRQALGASARLLQQNQPEEVIELLGPLNEADPENADLAINLGGAYVLLRKWDDAVDALTPAAEANPNNAMLWSNLAAAQLGRLETAGPRAQLAAIEAYKRALQADPKAPHVHYNLGLIFKERGDLDRAMAMFERALDVNPKDQDAAYWLERIERVLLEARAEQEAAARADAQNGADEAPDEATNVNG